MDVQASRVTLRPGGGDALPGPFGRSILIKAYGSDSAEAYSLLEFTAPPGGPWTVPHIHHDAEEAWYILEGEFTFQIGDDRTVASAGSFLLVPRGVVHSFGNTGTAVGRNLTLFSPPGMERYFVALHELIQASGGQPNPAAMAELAGRFRMEVVPTVTGD